MAATADLIDAHSDQLQSCSLQLRSFGLKTRFSGAISTLRLHEDNQLVRQKVAEPGGGRVLVIDGGGSLRTALVGDLLAERARSNGWSGLIVNGAIRDSKTIDDLNFAVKALGTNPRKSSKSGSGDVDVTVEFGEVRFTPGHFLWSDADGIVVAERDLTAQP